VQISGLGWQATEARGSLGRRGISSVGRAPALQAGGRRFDPGILHLGTRRKGQWRDDKMPTVLRDGPYRLFFYSNEKHEPPHIHVQRDDCVAKIWLGRIGVAANYGFAAHELNAILRMVREHEQVVAEAWHGHFESTR
jgi:hypothetical protein